MKKVLLLISIIVLLASIAWLIFEPGWEPFIGIISSIGTLIGLYMNNNDDKPYNKMKQKGGKNSTNYQSGGNITINNK